MADELTEIMLRRPSRNKDIQLPNDTGEVDPRVKKREESILKAFGSWENYFKMREDKRYKGGPIDHWSKR